MKTSTNFGFRWIIMVGMAISISPIMGCSKNDTVPSPPVEVRFQLLTADGEPATSFREGEDIIFDYRMINTSNEDIVWYDENDLDKPFYPVFDVYKGVVSENLTLVGSTHQPYIFYGRWGSSLPAADSVFGRVAWLGDPEKTKVTWGSIKYLSNSVLSKDLYVVKFEQAIKFSKYEGLHVDVQLPFEIL